MPTQITHERTALLEALLGEARAEADALRRRLEHYERIVSSTRMIMGHELKKPTTAIAGYLDLVREDLERSGARSTLAWLEKARAEVDLLDQLNEFYLDLLRVDDDEPRVGREEVDVRTLLDGVVDGLAPELHAEARVDAWVDRGVHRVPCNANALRLVVMNLVENALRYSPPESPVRVEVERATDRRGIGRRPILRVRVIDEGEGIPADQVERVFAPFVRLRDDVEGGAGLGLTLVRSLVEMLEGEVTVRSRPGRGTTVHVTLPLDEDPPEMEPVR